MSRILAPGLALLFLVAVGCGDDRAAGPEVDSIDRPVLAENIYIDEASWWQVSAEAGDRGSGWRQPAYEPTNNPGWDVLRAPLGYGESYVNPIPYGPDAAHKPPTVYFRVPVSIVDASAVVELRLRVMYDDGFVVYLNGVECGRANMPAGPVVYSTLATGHEAEGRYTSFDITRCKGLLVTGNNSLSIEVHQASPSSSDLVFDASLVATERRPAPWPAADGIARRQAWTFWDRGGDLGSAWRAGGFDDSSWRYEVAPLGYGESYLASSVSYGPDAAHKYITTYFRKQFTVDDPTNVHRIVGELMVDDGVIVYLNGHRVGSLGLPEGASTASTLASNREPGGVYESFDWTAQRPWLVAGVNTIAAEVHQTSPSSSDLVFDLSLTLDRTATPAPSPIAPRSTWKYDDRGAFPGAAWRALDFDDGAWPSGAGPLGYGEAYLGTTVAYGADPAHKPVTVYFRKVFQVDLPDGFAVNGLHGDLLYDDGAVVYLNGQEVQRVSMPAGAVTATTLALGHEAGNVYEPFDWAAARALVHAGTNALAVEVHQASAASSDLVFDLALDVITAPRFTRAPAPIARPSGDQQGPTYWRATQMYAPDALRLPSGTWLMYYVGNENGGGPYETIGRAVSANGIDWSFDEAPIGVEGGDPSVVFDGTSYRMWHTSDLEGGIFLATSTDGIHWIDGSEPVLWGSDPCVLLDGSTWKAWYQAWDGQALGIEYATSPDGLSWTSHGQVLRDARRPDVIHVGDGYEMWFTRGGGVLEYASSDDGVAWRLRGESLTAAPAGAWDAEVASGSVVRIGDSYRLFYGVYGPEGGLGVATSP